MKDQHTKIKGYRDLSQEEIDLMNRIKEHGEKTRELAKELSEIREHQILEAGHGCDLSYEQVTESQRCLSIACDHLQTGQMWFVRAVALPESF